MIKIGQIFRTGVGISYYIGRGIIGKKVKDEKFVCLKDRRGNNYYSKGEDLFNMIGDKLTEDDFEVVPLDLNFVIKHKYLKRVIMD